MKKCPKCGKEYDDNIKFCQVDGTQLNSDTNIKKCSKCGCENDPDANFCKSCGNSLATIVMKCSKCGKEYTDGENFCKDCGGKIVESGNFHQELPHDMVYVEGGSLWLGDNYENDDDENNNPRHKVILDSFYISKYQVTQQLYQNVIGDNPSKFIGKNRPVDSVNWYEAIVFCNELSKKEGLELCYMIDKNRKDLNNKDDDDNLKWTVKCNFMVNGYRLPTEAEWEYAARGGQESRGYRYAGSNYLDEVSWCQGNTNYETQNVGGKMSNELGLYDMSGNVEEWCWDWYDDEIDGVRNPTGALSGSYRVKRGGSHATSWFSLLSHRSRGNPMWHSSCPGGHFSQLGFRLVRSSF